ncbi:TetR family transcriptional regulator [Spirochaetia bacterium]|nr:TetR family transcriptional regulator [Spirochaetia bacterium]
MRGKTGVHSEQITQSKTWIFEALIRLMEKKAWHKITISDITKKAGVARQTFYRHYKSKEAVILQFLDDCFKPNHIKVNIHNENNHDTLMVVLPWQQFVRNAVIMKKIFTSEAESLIYICAKKWEDYLIDLYKDKLSGEDKLLFSYMIKYANGGALRVICDWIKNDMPISAKKIGSLLANLPFVPPTGLYKSNTSGRCAEFGIPFEKPGSRIPKIILCTK